MPFLHIFPFSLTLPSLPSLSLWFSFDSIDFILSKLSPTSNIQHVTIASSTLRRTTGNTTRSTYTDNTEQLMHSDGSHHPTAQQDQCHTNAASSSMTMYLILLTFPFFGVVLSFSSLILSFVSVLVSFVVECGCRYSFSSHSISISRHSNSPIRIGANWTKYTSRDQSSRLWWIEGSR